jgi:hypothetical protein
MLLQFWSKEIIVKVEYKYCPNLTIIDTPGLISAAPGRANAQLQSSSRAIEQMVRVRPPQAHTAVVLLCVACIIHTQAMPLVTEPSSTPPSPLVCPPRCAPRWSRRS